MNMVRIRHIMEMRRACKAPPLLPPKLRKEGSESTDRRGPKDVMDLTFRVNTLAPERYASSSFYLHLYESQDSSEGPWNLMARFDLEIRSMADNVDSCICSCSMLLSVFDDRESAEFFEYAAIHLNVRLVHIPLCRVAEALLNPLGEDDDDFECNWFIDRNMSTGFEIIDTCHDSCPPLKLEEPDDEKGTMYWCQ
ncbi:hypothetical protein CRE_03572 [Caenorhabditis remanei]|uniref:Bestrophin homolog n=1 Tax=Caenorhabditis remanei TaxID=31234 RepID=E3NSU8_CAERE|nr:hypothetical protein CRE_03572 [Caenorhabditis remanei]